MREKSCGIDGSSQNRTKGAAGLSSVQYETSAYFHEICRRPKTLFVDALQDGVCCRCSYSIAQALRRKFQGPHAVVFRNSPSRLATEGMDGLDEQVFWLRGRSTCPTFPRRPARRLAIAKWLNVWGFRRSLQRRNHPGITPGCLLSRGLQARRHSSKTTICCGR